MTAEPTSPTDLAQLSGTYTLDPTHTEIGFVARHAMVTKVRGSFSTFEGTGVVDTSDFSRSTITVSIDAKSIDTRNEQRDGHLRSNDFLSMDEYPTITFTSTKVVQTSPTSADVTGDLTIKGVTNPVTVPFEFQGAATDPFGNLRIGFEGSTVINRKDWGITWNAPLETGGVLVSEKVTLQLDISAIKSA
jgi:polyisoprenoid-binding protein YceI